LRPLEPGELSAIVDCSLGLRFWWAKLASWKEEKGCALVLDGRALWVGLIWANNNDIVMAPG